MKKLSLIALLTGVVTLAGCTVPGGAPEDLTNKIKQAQAYAQALCAYVPTVGTIAAIFASGNKELQTALSAATAICAAVTKPQARRGSVPKVAGVVVKGHFVRR